MKKIFLITTSLFLMISCGKKDEKSIEKILESNDVSLLKEHKTRLDKERQELTNKLKSINVKLAELEPNKNMPLVTAISVKVEPFVHYIELQGNVKTKKNMLVYPEAPGILKSILVKQGQYVRKGQVLAVVDDGGLSNQLAQVKTGLALAKTTYERQERLWKQKIGSEIQYLQAKTNYESTLSSKKQLEQAIGRYNIKAPFNGVIDEVMKEAGGLVAPGRGSEICRVVNLSEMYISTDVPESYISTVKKGKTVNVDFPVLGKKIVAKVSRTTSNISPLNRTFVAEVNVPNKDKNIKPNLTAKLSVNDYSNKNAILIPQSVISEDGEGKQYVYTVANVKGKTVSKRVFIKVGKSQDGRIEVLEGLSDGSKIISEGARSVKDGQEVKVLDHKM